MTHDTGFAPNPCGDVLSLATCKPGIRQCALVGEWVAGFTSMTLCGADVGDERLIYLMQVSQQILFEEYYEQYPDKRPENCVCGDNIYRIKNGIYEQVPNRYHGADCCSNDTSCRYVLLSTEFYYFGCKAAIVPKECRPNLVNRARFGSKTTGRQAQVFIDWVKNVAAKNQQGIIGKPHNGPPPGSCSNTNGRCLARHNPYLHCP